MDSGRWYISAVKVRCFRSFGRAWTKVHISSPFLSGIVGANGTGKSTLLQCILFANGSSASDLGVKTLKELCNFSIGDQLCEVEIQISNTISCRKKQGVPNACKGSGTYTATTIRTSLLPDGSRQFQIDGKNKTMLQVKEFLRSLGVCLDTGTSVIRQATVTQLADNTAKSVGRVLATASGLDRWEGETSKAKSEVDASRQAMKDINANVTKLEGMIRADNTRIEQVEQLERLQKQEREVAGSLVLAYDRQCRACEHVLSQAEAELNQATAQLSRLRTRLTEVEDEDVRINSNRDQDVRDEKEELRKKTLQLVGQVAAIQEQVDMTAGRVSLANTGQKRQDELQNQLNRLRPQHACAQQALRNTQETLPALRDDHDDVDGQAGTADVSSDRLQQLWSRCQAHTATLHQQSKEVEGRLSAAIANLNWHQQEILSLEQQHQQHLKVAADLGCPSIPTNDMNHDPNITVADLTRNRRTLEERIRSAGDQARVLTARIRMLGGNIATEHDKAPKLPARLHTLFTVHPASQLRHAQASTTPSTRTGTQQGAATTGVAGSGADRANVSLGAEKWVHALSVVAGGSLDVVVAESSSQACDVLKDPHLVAGPSSGLTGYGRRGVQQSQKLRIWPLDRILVKDLTERQRTAQTALGADRVVLPLDLLRYPPCIDKAMVRAFGGCVLAADSTTAAVLAQRYGLASVTPDGTMSRKGTVQGGCLREVGGGRGVSAPEEVMSRKVEEGIVMAELSSLTTQLSLDREALSSILRQIKAVMAKEASAQQVHQAAVAVSKAQQQVDTLQVELGSWRNQLENAQKEENRYQQLCSAPAAPADPHASDMHSMRSRAALHNELVSTVQQEILKHKVTITAVSNQLQALQGEMMELDGQRRMLVMEATADGMTVCAAGVTQAGAWPVEMLQAHHRQLKSKLQTLQEELLKARRAQVEADRCIAEAQAHTKQMQARREELRKHVQGQFKVVASKEEQVRTRREMMNKVSALGAELCKQYGLPLPTSTINPPAAPAAAHDDNHVDEVVLEGHHHDVDGLMIKMKQVSKARQTVEAVGAKALTAIESKACDARREDVGVFQQHLTALAAASDALDEGIRQSHQQVLATHAAISQAVGVRFQEICTALLPGLTFTLTHTSTTPTRPATTRQAATSTDETKAKEPEAVILFRRAGGRQLQAVGAHVSGGAPTPVSSSLTGDDWIGELEQLSGGQRTLVSLALLLAAALEGSCSRVLLLDEVDAALDEANQAAVAQLLHALANGMLGANTTTAGQPTASMQGKVTRTARETGAAGGVQVVCVSHHAAFQEVCNDLIKISRKEGASTVGNA